MEGIWYPLKKIDILRKKLIGVNSMMILIEELDDTQHYQRKYYKRLREAILGKEMNKYRYEILKRENGDYLNVVD